MQRQFKAERPNQAWVSDITYVRIGQSWLYLAALLDLFSRRVVGWSIDASLANELTLKALQMRDGAEKEQDSIIQLNALIYHFGALNIAAWRVHIAPTASVSQDKRIAIFGGAGRPRVAQIVRTELPNA